MNHLTRRQLTLFVNKQDATLIEHIRRTYNPQQHQLICSHVTLCREDEIPDMDQLLNCLKCLNHHAIRIQFAKPARFGNDEGAFLPGAGDNVAFQQLREKLLLAFNLPPSYHQPHITLMHPRNSTCSNEIFAAIKSLDFPECLEFDTISLIEQTGGGPWNVLNTFQLKGNSTSSAIVQQI